MEIQHSTNWLRLYPHFIVCGYRGWPFLLPNCGSISDVYLSRRNWLISALLLGLTHFNPFSCHKHPFRPLSQTRTNTDTHVHGRVVNLLTLDWGFHSREDRAWLRRKNGVKLLGRKMSTRVYVAPADVDSTILVLARSGGLLLCVLWVACLSVCLSVCPWGCGCWCVRFEKCLIKLPERISRNAIWVKMCRPALLAGANKSSTAATHICQGITVLLLLWASLLDKYWAMDEDWNGTVAASAFMEGWWTEEDLYWESDKEIPRPWYCHWYNWASDNNHHRLRHRLGSPERSLDQTKQMIANYDNCWRSVPGLFHSALLSRALESSSFSTNDAASFINLWDVEFIRPDHHSNIVLDFLINSSEYSFVQSNAHE